MPRPADDFFNPQHFDKHGWLTFEGWLAKIDARVIELTGLDRECFADWEYASAFEDGVAPEQAALEVLAHDSIGAAILEAKGIRTDEGEIE